MPAKAATATKQAAPKVAVVRRTHTVGPVVIRVVEGDISKARVDAVVNAANSLSFTPMDGGVSGALRNACQPDTVTGVSKLWWDDEGVEHEDIKLPTTQAGVQHAAGNLRDNGVRFIIHAVGPIWTDYPIKQSTFRVVLPLIRRTVRRALCAATKVHATSCALPAISGGIFTHWREGSNIKEEEQRAARQAVVSAVFEWAAKNQGSTVTSIDLCDIGGKQGRMGFFLEAFDDKVHEFAALSGGQAAREGLLEAGVERTSNPSSTVDAAAATSSESLTNVTVQLRK